MNLLNILLQAAPVQGQNGSMSFIIMMVIMFAIFYFMIMRPQQKKQKEMEKFRQEMQSGSKVMTVGGIHGTVVTVYDTTVLLNICTNVNIIVEKSCIVANSVENATKEVKKEEEKEIKEVSEETK